LMGEKGKGSIAGERTTPDWGKKRPWGGEEASVMQGGEAEAAHVRQNTGEKKTLSPS